MAELNNESIQLFEDAKIRTAWDEEVGEWYFSIVDVVSVLTESADANAYWRKLKQRLREEGNETVTNCHGLKMTAADGKKRLTDVANTEQLLRIVQSIPSKRAEPFKLWLAQVGRERIEETIDPELSIDRARRPRRRRRRGRRAALHRGAHGQAGGDGRQRGEPGLARDGRRRRRGQPPRRRGRRRRGARAAILRKGRPKARRQQPE